MLLLLLNFSLSIALAQRGANVIHQSIMVLIRMSKLQQMVLARDFIESSEFKGTFLLITISTFTSVYPYSVDGFGNDGVLFCPVTLLIPAIIQSKTKALD